MDLDGLPVELLCVGTEKGTVEVYDVDVVDVEDSDEDESENKELEKDGSESDEAEGSDKIRQTAEVERIGTLVGHTNRYVHISGVPTSKNVRLMRSR